jgi:hypothetical protein
VPDSLANDSESHKLHDMAFAIGIKPSSNNFNAVLIEDGEGEGEPSPSQSFCKENILLQLANASFFIKGLHLPTMASHTQDEYLAIRLHDSFPVIGSETGEPTSPGSLFQLAKRSDSYGNLLNTAILPKSSKGTLL